MYMALAHQAFARLLMMAFYGSVMIVVVMMARTLLKRAPRWICCVMWALVAFRLLCPLDLPSGLSVYNIPEIYPSSGSGSVSNAMINEMSEKGSTGPAGEQDAYSAAGNGRDISPDISGSSAWKSISDAADDDTNTATVQNKKSRQSTQLAAANAIYKEISPYIVVIWASGVLMMLVYIAAESIRLRRKAAVSVKADDTYINKVMSGADASMRARVRPEVFICDDIASPFIAGIIRPRIYMPSGLDAETAACVMAHETAHIKRGDNIWKMLGCALRTVYWFDPLVWLAYELFSRDIEIACDERVVKDMGREGKARYSQALLACSAPRRRAFVYSTAFGEAAVKERVIRVMNYRRPALWIVICALAACAALALFFMTGPAGTPGRGSGGAGDGDIINAAADPDIEELARKANTSVQLTEEQVAAVLETNGFTLEKTEKPDFLNGNGTVVINGYEKEFDMAPICYSVKYPGLEERIMLLYVYDAYYKARDIKVCWYTEDKTFTTAPIAGKNISLELAYPDGIDIDDDDGDESGKGMSQRIFEAMCMDAFNGSMTSYSGESENWRGSLDLYSYETADGAYLYGSSRGVIKASYKNGDIKNSRVKGYSVDTIGMNRAFETKSGKARPEFKAYEDGYAICTVDSICGAYDIKFSYDDGSSETLTISRAQTEDKINELTESIKYQNGRIYFTIPESQADWNIRIKGRVDNGSADENDRKLISYLNDESLSGDWIRGKTYSFDVSGGGYIELFIEAGADGTWAQHKDLLEMLPAELRGHPVQKLLNLNGSLYRYTGETQIMGDSGAVAGYIASTVSDSETPKENAQSNFGCVGNPFTRDSGDGEIVVFMDDEEYHVFKKM